MIWALTTLQQWVLFAATAVVLGCVSWRWLIAPRALGSLSAEGAASLVQHDRRVARIALIAALAVTAAWLLRMIVQVISFRDPFVPLWEDVSFLLFEMFWGTVWMAQGVVVLLLVGSFLSSSRRGAEASSPQTQLGPPGLGWVGAVLLALALSATIALSSHAMGVDSGRVLAVAADGLHVIAAGCWIGSLAVILIVARGSAPGEGAMESFAAQIRSFSPLALVGGSTLIAMGIVLSWAHLTALSDLWSSTYGRVLSAKVALALVVFALGFVNWRSGLPVCHTPDGSATVRRRAAREVGLAVAVILVTAVLVHSPKP